ncbi:MAG: ATP-binding protein [Pseudonocardiales bacterium]|nr:ATP-binding protein [Pseudonocardiales bacterium]
MPERLTVDYLATNPELRAILVQHAYRGVRVQFLLRSVLVAFMVIAIAAVPPARDRSACYLIVVSYVLAAVAVALWTRHGGEAPIRWMWLALVGDAVALATLTLVAGASAEQSWTADLLVNGFFLIPMLAATQLRPVVCALVTGPAVVAYFSSSVATKAANTEPWGSIVVRTLVLIGLGIGCYALSRVQVSRVLTIAQLAQDRTDLLGELLTLQDRERGELAEQLHDGALQYVLAARHDLEDARAGGAVAAFGRVEYALAESAQLLRSTVSQLHPAVLQQAGLARAVADLADAITGTDGIAVEIDVTRWPNGGHRLDSLIYGCARELLINVVKHAEAHTVRVQLGQTEGYARLVIGDDGRGIEPGREQSRLAQGHVGLASLRTRVAAAGGTVEITSPPSGGTSVEVTVPVVYSSRP